MERPRHRSRHASQQNLPRANRRRRRHSPHRIPRTWSKNRTRGNPPVQTRNPPPHRRKKLLARTHPRRRQKSPNPPHLRHPRHRSPPPNPRLDRPPPTRPPPKSRPPSPDPRRTSRPQPCYALTMFFHPLFSVPSVLFL